MNKKAYIAPAMEQMTMELGSMLAASERVSIFSDSDNAVDASSSLSNEHRGGWGNLWD